MNRNITALILIVLAIGVYFTYTSGQITVLKSIQAENDQYLSAINSAEKLIKLRDSVLNQYNSISDVDKARLDKLVPDNIDNVRLIIDISGIAGRHGLTAAGITTSADTNNAVKVSIPTQSTSNSVAGNGSLSTVTVTFNVTTTYANFITFLQDLERSLRILDVNSITLSTSANGVYTYGVTLNTYWLKQ
jgi:Tfp pilus assembly protein PilO